MRHLYCMYLLLAFCMISCNQTVEPPVEAITPEVKTTTYYLIRHAEKDRSDPENRNPELTEEGMQRSLQWSNVFADIPLDMVYTTNYTRTKSTAYITSKSKSLEMTIYDPRQLYDADFQEATHGKTVLVVGHSNTTPSLANAMLGEERYPSIDDTNNGNLYIITITGDTKTSQLLHIN